MILTFAAVPFVLREACFISELLQQSGLLDDLRPAHLKLLKLHGDFFASLDVLAEENLAKRPRSYHPAHLVPVVNAHFIRVVGVAVEGARVWALRRVLTASHTSSSLLYLLICHYFM